LDGYNGFVRQATISETNNAHPGPDEGRLARLERAGIIRRARRGRLPEILNAPPPAAEAGGDILRALLEERRSNR